MDRIRSAFDDLPIVARHAVVGAVVLGVAGGILGLVIGLQAHAPTAWAAAFELGIPAATLGALLGVATGSVASAMRLRSGRR